MWRMRRFWNSTPAAQVARLSSRSTAIRRRAFASSPIFRNHLNQAKMEPKCAEPAQAVPKTPVEDSQNSAKEAKPLPKLTPAEFREYNRMAEHMDYFHSHFRETWNVLYGACESGKRPKNMSIRQFLNLGQQFNSQLNMHHGIEERHIFPLLAKKMPAFKKELELLTQHKQIHKGMDVMGKYLDECCDGERELRMRELKEIMDGFGTVLWQHLDDEVKELGAENMRKYWTIAEMRRLPM